MLNRRRSLVYETYLRVNINIPNHVHLTIVPSLRIKIITTAEEFASIGDQWMRLAMLDDEASLFSDWQWNNLWWQHYSHLGSLHVVLVFDDTRDDQPLVGIGPFYRNQSKAMGLGKVDTLRFIGTGGNTSPDDVNIVAHPSLRAPVAKTICEHLFDQPFKRILLMEVCERSSFYKAFTSEAEKMPGYAAKPIINDRLIADLPEHWADFRQQISRNTHKQMKRRFNKVNALGNARFNICKTQEEVNDAFDALVRLHVLRWEEKSQHSGSFGTEDYRQFHKQLMCELLRLDQLWLVTLEVDDVIVAVEYAFLHKQILMFFQTGFDPEFKHLSPGHVLMTYMIQTAIEKGLKRIDLLKGDYEYKTSYANQVIRTTDLGYYAPGMCSFMAKVNDHRRELKRA